MSQPTVRDITCPLCGTVTEGRIVVAGSAGFGDRL